MVEEESLFRPKIKISAVLKTKTLSEIEVLDIFYQEHPKLFKEKGDVNFLVSLSHFLLICIINLSHALKL